MNYTRLASAFKIAQGKAYIRNFHAGGKQSSSILEADGSNKMNHWYHTSGLVLAGLTPIAFVLGSTPMNMPVDLALGALIPFHSHVALNAVISDYVPKPARFGARAALLAATIVTVAGLMKLNIEGPGITETLKSLWRKPSNKTNA